MRPLSQLRKLYERVHAFDSFHLDVGDGHSIYVEQAGNPRGIPVVFFHGGPGGGIDPIHRRYFDPARYRVVLFNQRGAGRSRPHAELRSNTTWDLVADAERIRERLGIERWHLFGGSWGSTLALAYASKHPEPTRSLILRGIFTLREQEVTWFYREGASYLFPDRHAAFLNVLDADERDDVIGAYYKRLTSDDLEVRLEAAQAWARWEGSTSRLVVDEALIERCGTPAFALALARIECHYFVNKGFFDHDGWLLEQASKLSHLPLAIVQGRYDVVCPMQTAYELHQQWPGSTLNIVPDAGHASSEPGVVDALIRLTDEFAALD